MRVPVHDDADRIAGQRLLEPAAPEIGKDLERLPFDGVAHRGVVQDGDLRGHPQARERAYAAIDLIDWPEGFCRRDIAAKAVAG